VDSGSVARKPAIERLRPGEIAAVLAATAFAGVALFEVALAVGAPWGHAAWGGEHAELSGAQRIGSAVAVIVWVAAAVIVLGRAGLWARRPRLALVFRWGTWFLAALSVLAALVNFASQSRWENFIFGPLALLLAILCTLVARADSSRDDKPR
jgi:drug/metabolite transporter (DMT)-like permease